MNLDSFLASLGGAEPPASLPPLVAALWHDAAGDWHAAHAVAQAQDTPAHCRLHAYLHRKEGDTANARYWYARAGRPMPRTSLPDEWRQMARDWLAEPPREP